MVRVPENDFSTEGFEDILGNGFDIRLNGDAT
jgi:hypothetical protein